MKFVCDNCQAKYQIGDDKVAGKTVRMKCRKCGYNIKVSAADVVASAPDASSDPSSHLEAPASAVTSGVPVSTGSAVGAPNAPLSAPGSVPSPFVASPLGHAAPPRPQGAGGVVPPRGEPARQATPAAQPPGWSEDDESTQMMNFPVQPAQARAAGPTPAAGLPAARSLAPRAPAPVKVGGAPAAPAPRPPGAPAPRTITSSGSRAVAMGPPPPNPATPAPVRQPSGTMPRPAALGSPRPVTRTVTGPAAAVHDGGSPTTPARPDASARVEHEWYVGIGGTPIGPVKLSVVRERAAAQEVDGESLVWREGMAEWKALRNYPELLEVVNEARSGPAPNPAPMLVTPAPLTAVAGLSAPVPTPAAAAAPTPAPAAAAPANAPPPVAPTAAPAPAPPAGGAAGGFLITEAPPSKRNGKSNGAHAAAMGVGIDAVSAAPLVPASAEPAAALAMKTEPAKVPPKAAPVDDIASLEESLIPRRRGGVHPMAYAFVAAAAVFGGVAAWVLLHPQQPQVVFVQAPTPTSTPTAVPDKGEPQVEVGEISTGTPGASAHPTLGGPRPKGTATAIAAGTSSPIDTSGFVSNVPGPAATGATPANAGGGQLSAGEISQVVSQNQAIIKRKCWVPALESKPPNGPSNAKVVGSLVIGPSGNVESANASGGDAFPGLSSCIAQRMKNWHFPASGGSTPVQVPFVFAGQ